MSRYSEKIKKLQLVQSVLIIVCVIGMAIFFYYLLKPKITSYQIKDECGPIGGAISHSLDDEDSCTNACNAYCVSIEKRYHEGRFTQNLEGCNLCDCSCAS